MFETAKQKFPISIDRLEFYVNNDYKDVGRVNPRTTLLNFLRNSGYVGAKYGCGEGGCGACCVVVADFDLENQKVRYRTVNSCLMPLCAVYGKQVITVEGIGCPTKPHPIQVYLIYKLIVMVIHFLELMSLAVLLLIFQ